MLFCPACQPKMFLNAPVFHPDAILFDLEDAVAFAEKDSARDLLCSAMEQLDFGKSLVFARINALKTPFGEADVRAVVPAGVCNLRLAMCECFKALGPQVQVSQWEVDRAGRSYTYNTVSMLQEKYPGAQLYMTIGSDMLETFDEWYRWREILAMVTLVVQSREPGDGDALHAAAQKLEEAGGKIMFADAPVLECASSDIRAGKYPPARLKELLPPPVADVIHRNGLYGKLI